MYVCSLYKIYVYFLLKTKVTDKPSLAWYVYSLLTKFELYIYVMCYLSLKYKYEDTINVQLYNV